MSEPTARRKRKPSGEIPGRIRQARQDVGWSQAKLGAAVSITQSAISLYESGARTVSIEILGNIAAALNRPFSYFLGREEEMISFRRDSEIGQMLAYLWQRPEKLPEIMEYVRFLAYRSSKRAPQPVS